VTGGGGLVHPEGENSSLVPRPFPRPLFDCLQYANMEGKAWEIWSHPVTSGRQMVDTRGAVPDVESQSPFLYYWSEGWRPEC